MQLLPEIIAERRKDARVEIELRVQPELAHFAGHFPGVPVLPGVVQIDWAIRLAQRHFEWQGEFSALENVKFLALVRPGCRLKLVLEFVPEKAQLSFSYATPARRVSSGRVVFAEAA